jgi:hypothetical protein
MTMQSHYGFTDEQYSALLKSGVTVRDLFDAIKFFDPNGTELPLSKISLLYYIDAKGDFREKPSFAHRRIARAFLDRLELPTREKLQIFAYIDFIAGEDDE